MIAVMAINVLETMVVVDVVARVGFSPAARADAEAAATEAEEADLEAREERELADLDAAEERDEADDLVIVMLRLMKARGMRSM